MLTCYKTLLPVILTTLLTAMVVLATNAPIPVRKSSSLAGGLLNYAASTYGCMQNRMNSTKTLQQWSEKFLAKREAAPHSAPFVVSIQMLTPNQNMVHYCAGTIINEHWILTAAHCLNSPQVVANSVIVAGSHDINTNDGSDRVQMRHIDYFVRHELYLGGVNPYDIALIYMKTPLEFNEYVQPAELPAQDAMPDGYGTLYGWGNVSMTAVPNFPHKLQEANMPILELDLCEQVLAESGMTLHETNLCTGPLTGGISICTADSGGPLVQTAGSYMKNAYTIIGIVSWGKMPCGQKNAPSVFVRVSAFTDWIQQIITTTTRFE